MAAGTPHAVPVSTIAPTGIEPGSIRTPVGIDRALSKRCDHTLSLTVRALGALRCIGWHALWEVGGCNTAISIIL